MISTKELRIIQNYTKLVSDTCVIHVDWDPATKLLTTSTTGRGQSIKARRKQALNYFYLSLNFFWLILSSWRVYYTTVLDPIRFDVSFQIIYILLMVGYTGICGLSNAFALIRNDLVVLFDQLLVCITREGCMNGRKSNMSLKSLHKLEQREKLVKFGIGFYMMAALTLTTVCTVMEAHFTWKMTSNCCLTLLTVVLNIPFICGGGATLFGLLKLFLILYFIIVKGSISRLQSFNQIPIRRSKLDELITTYRGLSLLCNNFNLTFCRLLVPIIKVVASLGLMICILVGFRFKDEGSLGSSFIRAGFIIIGIEMAIVLSIGSHATSGLWALSMDYIWNFKYKMIRPRAECVSAVPDAYDMSKYMKRIANSYQPLRFGVGGLYYMEREAKLTLAGFIASGTPNLLIAYK